MYEAEPEVSKREHTPLEQREKALEAAVTRLETATIMLEERFHPVLMPVDQTDDKPSQPSVVDEVLPRHHDALREQTRGLDRLCGRLEELYRRAAL